MSSTDRQQIGRHGGLVSWSRTVDRTARTAASRDAGPGHIDYWLARLDPERFADATDEQRLAAAKAAKAAHYADLARRSAKARRAVGERRPRGATAVATTDEDHTEND